MLFPAELDVHSFLLDKEEYVVLEAAARNVFVGRLWWVTSGDGCQKENNQRACAHKWPLRNYIRLEKFAVGIERNLLGLQEVFSLFIKFNLSRTLIEWSTTSKN